MASSDVSSLLMCLPAFSVVYIETQIKNYLKSVGVRTLAYRKFYSPFVNWLSATAQVNNC
jgi:hypothetical protein